MKMAHVVGKTSVLASVSGPEKRTVLAMDPPVTTQWALKQVRPTCSALHLFIVLHVITQRSYMSPGVECNSTEALNKRCS